MNMDKKNNVEVGLCAIYTEFISDDIAELKSNFQKLSDVIIACGGDNSGV